MEEPVEDRVGDLVEVPLDVDAKDPLGLENLVEELAEDPKEEPFDVDATDPLDVGESVEELVEVPLEESVEEIANVDAQRMYMCMIVVLDL